MFVQILAETCRPFLTRLQSQRPLIQELLPYCCQLFVARAENVMEPEKVPHTAQDIATINLKDASIYKAAFIAWLPRVPMPMEKIKWWEEEGVRGTDTSMRQLRPGDV